jgi:hypothetical protein
VLWKRATTQIVGEPTLVDAVGKVNDTHGSERSAPGR